MKKEEEWKNIEGFPGYQISNWGRVKSLSRLKKMPTGGFHVLPEVIMNPKKIRSYNGIKLCLNGKHFTKRIARLVGAHFIPNPLNKPLINHKDADKNNDYFENLEWATESENMKHAYDYGLLKMPWENKDQLIVKKSA